MDEILLSRLTEDGRHANEELCVESERSAHAFDNVERWVGAGAFDGRDVGAGQADRICDLPLTHSQRDSCVPAGTPERGSKGRRSDAFVVRHLGSQTLAGSPALISRRKRTPAGCVSGGHTSGTGFS